MQNKKQTRKNNLLEARRRCALDPKQISFLLGRNSTDDLHRYENGVRLPSLPTLLRLSVILATPPHFLYQDLYNELKTEIADARKRHPQLFPERDTILSDADKLKLEEGCFYAEVLKTRMPTKLELDTVNKHVINIMKTVSDYKQGLDPFSLL